MTKPTRGRPTKPTFPETFLGRVASRLRALRVERGLTVEEAAEAITAAGYTVAGSTVYRWEAGLTQPHLESLPALSKAYKTHLSDLLPKE